MMVTVRRKLSNLAALPSLLLFAAAIALLLRSYHVGDVLELRHESRDGVWYIRRELDAATGQGWLVLGWHSLRRSPPPEPEAPAAPGLDWRSLAPGVGWRWVTQPPEGLINMGWNDSLWGRRGFATTRSRIGLTPSFQSTRQRVGVPLWLPPALFVPYPLWRLYVAGRRYRRARTMRCVACGYDLRATPQGGAARSAARPPLRYLAFFDNGHPLELAVSPRPPG